MISSTLCVAREKDGGSLRALCQACNTSGDKDPNKVRKYSRFRVYCSTISHVCWELNALLLNRYIVLFGVENMKNLSRMKKPLAMSTSPLWRFRFGWPSLQGLLQQAVPLLRTDLSVAERMRLTDSNKILPSFMAGLPFVEVPEYRFRPLFTVTWLVSIFLLITC